MYCTAVQTSPSPAVYIHTNRADKQIDRQTDIQTSILVHRSVDPYTHPTPHPPTLFPIHTGPSIHPSPSIHPPPPSPPPPPFSILVHAHQETKVGNVSTSLPSKSEHRVEENSKISPDREQSLPLILSSCPLLHSTEYMSYF